MIRPTFRPITQWPGALTPPGKRKGDQFKADYQATLRLLSTEVEMLNGRDLVIQVALDEWDLKADGSGPLARARAAKHPGVIVSFTTKDHGALQYATDRFAARWSGHAWTPNLRAVALGLGALRAVDRYGIADTGQQYTGWKALGAGEPIALGGGSMTVYEAIAFLHEHTTPGLVWDYDDPEGVGQAYRAAARKLHPDAGGDPELFRQLQDAKAVLDQEAHR